MPGERPTLLSRIVKWAILRLFRWKGWRLEGGAPPLMKYVILGAPHTSNWDFVFFVGATWTFGVRPRFMGKHTLFEGALRRFMLDMGGVPVDRSASRNYVDQVVAQFAAHDDFRLVIAPEGTRKGVAKWRSGFYHIALGAGVPVVPAWVDNAAMRGGLGPPIDLTGDFATDIARISAFYRSVMPDHPRLQALYRMAEEAQ
ncbi:MAG: 1-acyl-sn-glycerol-3-phosphate acyltransferase [Novosphingobium sp.]